MYPADSVANDPPGISSGISAFVVGTRIHSGAVLPVGDAAPGELHLGFVRVRSAYVESVS